MLINLIKTKREKKRTHTRTLLGRQKHTHRQSEREREKTDVHDIEMLKSRQYFTVFFKKNVCLILYNNKNTCVYFNAIRYKITTMATIIESTAQVDTGYQNTPNRKTVGAAGFIC